MIISVSIGDVYVDFDDTQRKPPTLEQLESVLARVVNAAVDAYNVTGSETVGMPDDSEAEATD